MSSLEAAIRGAAELTAEQRRALLAVYRSFVASSSLTDDEPMELP